MRMDLPQCDFKNCRRCFDHNCNSKEAYRDCQYQQLRNKAFKVELVSSESGDWHGLYVNGSLIHEGHEIPVHKVVYGFHHFMPLDYIETSVPDEVAEQGFYSFKEFPG